MDFLKECFTILGTIIYPLYRWRNWGVCCPAGESHPQSGNQWIRRPCYRLQQFWSPPTYSRWLTYLWTAPLLRVIFSVNICSILSHWFRAFLWIRRGEAGLMRSPFAIKLEKNTTSEPAMGNSHAFKTAEQIPNSNKTTVPTAPRNRTGSNLQDGAGLLKWFPKPSRYIDPAWVTGFTCESKEMQITMLIFCFLFINF